MGSALLWTGIAFTVLGTCGLIALVAYMGVSSDLRSASDGGSGTSELTQAEAGTWDNWGGWGECSVTCSGHTGSRFRLRSCGRGNCTGAAKEEMACDSQEPCPGKEQENTFISLKKIARNKSKSTVICLK